MSDSNSSSPATAKKTKNKRRRYELRRADLNDQLEALLDAARSDSADPEDVEIVRQILVTGVRLLRDGTSHAELKLVNSALKELRHAFRIFSDYDQNRKVAVFGSVRTAESHPDWQHAFAFAQRMVDIGWMVITGAGDGIMGAAQGGAGRHASFGVNIRLPFEQKANSVIDGDHKLINFRYFFTRKVVFVKEAHAIVCFPGGFGTHDEGMEALTLIQTGKSEIVPVVFVDEPGGGYWADWFEYVRTHLGDRGLIAKEDLNLFKVTDSVEEAVAEIEGFYRNYHSSRYHDGRLILRMHVGPTEEELAKLNLDFANLLASGEIERVDPLPEEYRDLSHLARLRLHFDRRSIGLLRQLIDRLNQLGEEVAPPDDARRREIFASAMTLEQEIEEDDEDD